MKSSADLLYEQIIQLVEPLTRFDRTSLKRSVERETQAKGEVSRWVTPSLRLHHSSQSGSLPAGVRSFPSAAEASKAAKEAHAAAEGKLPERLRRWAAQHETDDAALTPRDCFEGPVTFGAEAKCKSCSGQGRNLCNSCGGRRTTQCYGCGGRGQSACRSCGGGGSQRCGSCGGMGRQQRYVTKTVWDGYNNRYNTHSETVMENCSMCMGTGQRTCDNCGGRRNLTCSTCAGRGQVNCGQCGAAGYVPCSTCAQTGMVHQLWRLDCSIAGRLEVEAAHDTAEVKAQLQACSLQQLGQIAAVRLQAPEVRGSAIRRPYAFACRITEMLVETEDQSVRIAAYGDQARVFNFHNIVGVLLEQDLLELEQQVEQAPTFALRSPPALMEAAQQCLQSEANAMLGEGGDRTKQLTAAGTLSSDYATRMSGALRRAFRKLYTGELALGALLAAALPALAVFGLRWSGWYTPGAVLFPAGLFASWALYIVAEVAARKRLYALFRDTLAKEKIVAVLRGQHLLRDARFVACFAAIWLLCAAVVLT